ncbi:MAG TPA: bifunctional DNA primase/polymerase [Chthoniobacteraceae bacterium]|nr:bifunctional DNA primase/polymerase [Chthoniobacteraceae bacterium]
MNPFIEAARAYIALGWYVFPCFPGTKKPATEHGCRDASNDPEQIERWWTQNPSYNIGLACGPASGVYVVDVDVSPVKGIDGTNSMMKLPALPVTPVAETPGGGFHWLFRTDDPPANKNAFRPGVDIRGDGYYILVAPSVHPNGGVYEWREGASPWDVPLAEYPEFMRPKKPKAAPWHAPGPRPAQNGVEERAIAYLAQCEVAVQGFNGHNKLLWAARAMVRGFQLPEEVAYSLLAIHYNPRCVPPWDLSNPREEKDFRRKIFEALRTPGSRPDGWLLEETFAPADEAFQAFADQLAGRLLRPSDMGIPISGQNGAVAAPEIDLLHPPGLVGEIAAWLEETALCTQPWLNLGAAITFCGALMGRKVRSETDSRTNIYAMAVAETSAGKDHARKALRKLAAEAGCLQLIGGEDVTSDAAIETQLEAQPVTLFLWDEIGHLFKTLQQDKNNSAQQRILPLLMRLYSSASETVLGKAYADRPPRVFDQPCLSIYGTGVPGRFMGGITAEQLSDGFLARLLVFISLTRPMPDIKKGKMVTRPVPPKLVERVRSLWQMVVAPPQEAGNIEAQTRAHQVTIVETPEAEAWFDAFAVECHKRLISPQEKDRNALWGKAAENARKLAMICAVGDCRDGQWGTQIELCHAEWASMVVTKIIGDFMALIADNMAETQFERDKLRVLRAIERGGQAGVRKMNVTRATQSLAPNVREMAIRDLVDSGLVVAKTEGSAVRYFKTPWGVDAPFHE